MGNLKASAIVCLLPFILVTLFPLPLSARMPIHSLELMAGHFKSPVIGAHHRQDLDYNSLYLRIGLLRPWEKTEGILEVSYNFTTRGPDGSLKGVTALIRQGLPGLGPFESYAQIGVGILYTDLYKDRSQDLIGNSIEFNPQVGIGLRYPISASLSINLEAGFQHISNAGLKKGRNIGVNGVGMLGGISWRP